MQSLKRVTIELTNRCNRTCPECPRHKMTTPQGDISPELFGKIVSQLDSNICIVPFYRGEPTLHKQFPQLMKELGRFKQVQLATNGDNLTEENKQAILDNCTFVSLSLHSYKLPNKTKWLPFLYDCLGAEVETQVSILETDMPPRRHGFFEALWLKHVNRVRIYKEHSRNGFGSMNGIHPTSMCTKPFEEMVVYWDGHVGLCNHDWNNMMDMGNLNCQTVADVWNGWEYGVVRSFQQDGRRREIPACASCDFQSNKLYGELIKHGR